MIFDFDTGQALETGEGGGIQGGGSKGGGGSRGGGGRGLGVQDPPPPLPLFGGPPNFRKREKNRASVSEYTMF